MRWCHNSEHSGMGHVALFNSVLPLLLQLQRLSLMITSDQGLVFCAAKEAAGNVCQQLLLLLLYLEPTSCTGTLQEA